MSAQKVCGVSILGDAPNLTTHTPEHPALIDPALSEEGFLDNPESTIIISY